MNTMIQMKRSTLLADVRSIDRRPPSTDRSMVRVGRIHIGMGGRTLVGDPMTYVGTDVTSPTSPGPSSPPIPLTTTQKVVHVIGTTAGYAVAAAMVAGPPMAGYLLFGTTGLVVGSVLAAPMAIYAFLSIANDVTSLATGGKSNPTYPAPAPAT
jgi:hypothetical protein